MLTATVLIIWYGWCVFLLFKNILLKLDRRKYRFLFYNKDHNYISNLRNFFCHLWLKSARVLRPSVSTSHSINKTQQVLQRFHILSHTDKKKKKNSKRTQFNGFLFVVKAQVGLSWNKALEQSPFLLWFLPISTSRVQLVLRPSLPLPTPQSLRVAVINWWQSRSPRCSSGPGSLKPVFWSTHQHFPRWPSRAGWHCGDRYMSGSCTKLLP